MRPISGLKLVLAAFAIVGVCGTSSLAQGAVPGGWDPQFSFQSFGPANAAGGNTFSFGMSGAPMFASPFGYGVSPFGTGGINTVANASRPNYYANGFTPSTSLTVDGTSFLANTVRKSVRTPRRR